MDARAARRIRLGTEGPWWRAVLAVVVVLVLGACSSATTPPSVRTSSGPSVSRSEPPASPSDQATDTVEQAVDGLRELPFTQRNVDDFASVLAAAGVEVVDDVDSPASAPVRVTRWQVENMAAEAANLGGVTGRTLAELAPTGPGIPPVPFLIAAWMLDGRTTGAEFARALYGDQDLADAYDLRFPDGVLVLFLADATAASATTRPATTAGSVQPAAFSHSLHVTPAVQMSDPLDSPCSAASNFVQRAIEAVANALSIKTTGGGFFGFLASVWNTAVALASRFVAGLIKTLTAPIVAQLVGVFNAIAAVEQVSSVLIAWRAPLTPTPATNRYGVDTEQVTGDVALQLQPHVFPVPPAVKDCAQSVGVDISATAAGSRLTWTTSPQPNPDLATTLEKDPALDVKESASLRYQTGTEPMDSLDAPEQVGDFAVSTTIRRNDVERARQLIAQLLLTQVPEYLRSLVESLARPIIDAATGKLAELTDVHSQTHVPITYHLTQGRCTTSRIAPGTYQGSVDTDLRNGAAKGHATGSVTIQVAADQSITGTLDLVSDARGGGLSMHAIERLRVSGTTANPVVTLEKRLIDGKDATFPQKGTTPPMQGVCPPGLRWDTSTLSPGTVTPTSNGIVITAQRID